MDEAEESVRQMTESTRADMTALAERVETNAQELSDASAEAARSAAQSAQQAAGILETVEAKGESISRIAVNSDTLAKQALEKATNAENEMAEAANSVDQLTQGLASLRLVTEGKVDDEVLLISLTQSAGTLVVSDRSLNTL